MEKGSRINALALKKNTLLISPLKKGRISACALDLLTGEKSMLFDPIRDKNHEISFDTENLGLSFGLVVYYTNESRVEYHKYDKTSSLIEVIEMPLSKDKLEISYVHLVHESADFKLFIGNASRAVHSYPYHYSSGFFTAVVEKGKDCELQIYNYARMPEFVQTLDSLEQLNIRTVAKRKRGNNIPIISLPAIQAPLIYTGKSLILIQHLYRVYQSENDTTYSDKCRVILEIGLDGTLIHKRFFEANYSHHFAPPKNLIYATWSDQQLHVRFKQKFIDEFIFLKDFEVQSATYAINPLPDIESKYPWYNINNSLVYLSDGTLMHLRNGMMPTLTRKGNSIKKGFYLFLKANLVEVSDRTYYHKKK